MRFDRAEVVGPGVESGANLKSTQGNTNRFTVYAADHTAHKSCRRIPLLR